MTVGHEQNDRGVSLREGFDRSGLTFMQAWVEYLTMGGSWSRAQVFAALRGEGMLDHHQHNKLATALNETFVEAGDDRLVAYCDSPNAELG